LSVEILLFKILIFPPRGLCLPGHTNFRVSFVTYIFWGFLILTKEIFLLNTIIKTKFQVSFQTRL